MDFSETKRSKSITSLHTDIDALSSSLEKFHYENESVLQLAGSGSGASSVEVSVVNDTGSEMDTSGEERGAEILEDSGVYDRSGADGELLAGLGQKMDKLTELFQLQSGALEALHADVRRSRQAVEHSARQHSQAASDLIDVALVQRLERLQIAARTEGDGAAAAAGRGAAARVSSRAQALLDALQLKQASSVEDVIRDALTEFLQSDALREHVAAATSQTVKEVIQSCFSSDVTASYLPMLERSHRQLMRQVSRALDEGFREMESSAGSISRSSHKTTRAIRAALERHQRLLEDAVERPAGVLSQVKGTIQKVLEKEMVQWRGRVLDTLSENSGEAAAGEAAPFVPSSPPQPAEPGRSAIDQLMSAAEINVQMKEGDVNGTFEKALLAADLTLVMAACRAADPARVFAPPCRLQQHVLLSLAQQLAADLVHDTQLKCRYLEDTIMNLDAGHPVTRSHLPQVLGEVCANLTKFLEVYPSHMSSRKIRMLVMAADSLVNQEATGINHVQ